MSSRRSPRRSRSSLGNLLPGRRLADLHDLRLDADLRPEGLPARGRPASSASRGASTYDELLALAALAPGLDLPLRHRLDGRRTSAGRASASRICSTSSSRCPQAKAVRFVSLEEPYDDSLTLDQARLPDVMLALDMDGAAAHPAARLAGARRDPRDVRLQGRQVADADRARRPPADRLLGRARLRPERLGRPLEWLRLSSAPRRHPPLRRRTERPLHWIHAAAFCVLLGSGLCLYLPSLAELVSRRPLLKSIHIYTAVAWAIALVLVVAVGDRRALRRTVSEVDALRRRRPRLAPRPPRAAGAAERGPEAEHDRDAPPSRSCSRSRGFFLWYGERDTRFRLAERAARPRLADVRLAGPVPRAPLPRADPAGDAPLAERDHPGLGARGLGRASAPRNGSRSSGPAASRADGCQSSERQRGVGRAWPLGDAGPNPVVGALGKPPLELRALGRVGRRRSALSSIRTWCTDASASFADLVSLLGDDRDGLDLVEQPAGEVVDLGRGRLAAGEDAEVHPDLDRGLLCSETTKAMAVSSSSVTSGLPASARIANPPAAASGSRGSRRRGRSRPRRATTATAPRSDQMCSSAHHHVARQRGEVGQRQHLGDHAQELAGSRSA